MPLTVITKETARRYLLMHQGLYPPRSIEGKDCVLELFRRLGCIQYDPLNIVGTNPALVLQSRVLGFTPKLLEEMLYQDRTLVDDWDKMMAIYPVEDRPYFHFRQREVSSNSFRRSAPNIEKIIPVIRREIEQRGPLSSLELDHDEKVDWAWGPMRLAKAALDEMYYRGELIIHHKVNTRKYYDLASRHIPAEIRKTPDPHPSIEHYHDWHVYRRMRGIGLAWNRAGMWHGVHQAKTSHIKAALSRLVEQGRAVEMQIENSRYRFYIAAEDIPTLDRAKDSGLGCSEISVIAPLDNLLWDRDMVTELFGFSYRWEVYKPVQDREYGYYVLPVLYGDRFIARFEPGREKKAGPLEIKNWWWEPDVHPDDAVKTALVKGFSAFVTYLGADKIKVKKAVMKRAGLDWVTEVHPVTRG